MADLEFISPNDGSTLSLTVTRCSEGETDFEVAVKTPWFSGVAPASTYMNGSPAPMFAEMASAWTGWKGQKKWTDLEQRVGDAANQFSGMKSKIAQRKPAPLFAGSRAEKGFFYNVNVENHRTKASAACRRSGGL